jgi:hypothetical protein
MAPVAHLCLDRHNFRAGDSESCAFRPFGGQEAGVAVGLPFNVPATSDRDLLRRFFTEAAGKLEIRCEQLYVTSLDEADPGRTLPAFSFGIRPMGEYDLLVLGR